VNQAAVDQSVPVPETLDELLSPEWLSRALSARFPGTRVTSVTRGTVVSRVSTNICFHIEGDIPDGLPADLCVKCYFSENGWSAHRTGHIEASFYRDLAPRAGVRTLSCYWSDVHPESGHGMVITEDVVVQGATFLDALSPYTPDQVAQSLQQYARLHASTWNDPVAQTASWLQPTTEARTVTRGVKEISANFESADLGPGVPEEARDADRLYSTFCELATLTQRPQPWTIVHGDAHIGNIYLDGAGRPSLIDWQLVGRAPWYFDVGYHIASALPVEDRRAHEDDLIRHYLAELRAANPAIPEFSAAEVRLGYRLGILYGFYHWGITKMVARPITGSLLHRLGTATADHDSYAAVAELR
jgi:hypothetical protein